MSGSRLRNYSGKEHAVYISGPMSGVEHFNYPAFDSAERMLRAAGFVRVSNPAAAGLVEEWEYADYLRRSLALMLECTAVALLPGWSFSPGATLEVGLARRLAMPCMALDDVLDRPEIAFTETVEVTGRFKPARFPANRTSDRAER